jgi:RNA polymerase sigma factor (sigma-70 family)
MASRPAHFERLLKFLRRKGRSREDAEDLIQEAMLRLHVYGREVAVANEEAFLRHAVHNLAVDQHRRDRLDLRREIPIEDINAHNPLIASASTPEDTLEAQQRLNHIRAVLDAVSLRTREIYFAHRAGYSYSEIANHMGISHITIKRHIARALLAIMEHGETEENGLENRSTE